MSEFCMKCYEGIFPHDDCKAKSSAPSPEEAKPESECKKNAQPCQSCRENGFPIMGIVCPRCGWSSKDAPAKRDELVEAASDFITTRVQDFRRECSALNIHGHYNLIQKYFGEDFESALRRALAQKESHE
jgi:hypothetical protein